MWLTVGIRRRYDLYKRRAATVDIVKAIDGISVRGSVNVDFQSFDWSDASNADGPFFWSLSLPDQGHRMFVVQRRREGSREELGFRPCTL